MMVCITLCSAPNLHAQQRGDQAYKGDITGRKFKPKKSPRPNWGGRIARPNPYAGRKRNSKASRAKAYRQVQRAPSKQHENAYGGRARTEESERITFIGKRRYIQGGGSGLSISRNPERPRKVKRITPRSASGAYRVRNRKNPYALRGRTPWEEAFQGDITGRRFRTKRTTGRPGIKEPPKINYTNPGRRGDKPYDGRIGINFNSISRSRERAGRATNAGAGASERITFTSKRRYQRTSAGLSITRDPERPRKIKRVTPRSASGAYRVRKRKNPYVFRERSPWEKAFQGDITGRTFRTKRTTDRPGIAKPPDVNYTSKGRRGDKAYSGRIQAGFRSNNDRRERAWKNDISGNPLRIRTSPRPKFRGAQFKAYSKRKPGGDQPYQGKIKGGAYNSISSLKERVGKKRFSSRPPGEGTWRAGNFQGNIKASRSLKGGGSISGKVWNNQGRPIKRLGPGGQDISIARFQGDRKGRKILKGGGSISGGNWNNGGKPVIGRGPRAQDNSIARFQGDLKGKRILKGGGSISGGIWNNHGRPIKRLGPGGQDISIARFQGDRKGRKILKGGGSISGGNWNNRGKPIAGRGPKKQDNNIARFQGDLKGQRVLKGGGSISGGIWNNHGRPIKRLGPGGQDISIARFQGDIKGRKVLKGGGSISRDNWNNEGQPIAGRGLRRQDFQSAGFQGNIKKGSITAPDNRGAASYSGKIPAYMLKKGPDDNFRFTGNIKRRRKYVKNPNAVKESLKVKALIGNDRSSSANYRGRIPAYTLKKGPNDYNAFRGNLKQIQYEKSPHSAKLSLKVKPPAKALVNGMRFEGTVKVSPSSYKRNPNSAKEALKGRAPSKAAMLAGNFQGNFKMEKRRIEDRHPGFKYFDSRSNGKKEKEKFFSFRLFWSRLFKRNENQPDNLKEPDRKPRYDKGEQGLWND